MTKEELQIKLTELLPAATAEEGTEWMTLSVNAEDWPSYATALRNATGLNFDYLFCLTCVDWKTHLGMVYHLESTTYRNILVIKIKLDRNDPKVKSVSHIWRTAEFHEREVFELFGVNFQEHPDLRLLILPDGWEGRFPLRKDFEDEVNMIRL